MGISGPCGPSGCALTMTSDAGGCWSCHIVRVPSNVGVWTSGRVVGATASGIRDRRPRGRNETPYERVPRASCGLFMAMK